MKLIEKLSDKKSLEVVKNIQKFVHLDFKLIQNKPKTEISKHFQDFITSQINLFGRIWNIDYSYNTEAYAAVCDGLEKNLCINLYNKIFSSTPVEIEEDYKYETLIENIQFLNFKNHDINKKSYNEVYMNLAISSLEKINHYKAPKEKISCIINYCNIITKMIYDMRKKPTGADEAYPFFVYGLQKGNIRKLKSNLTYIENFRHRTRFESEEAYYFTTICSAIQFIENIKHSDVNLSENEFNEKILEEKKIIEKKREQEMLSPLFKKNNDESYLLYYLNNSKNDENSNYVELTEFNYSNETKVPKTLSENLLNYNDAQAIFMINLDRLYKEYFTEDLNKMSLSKLEKMFNDFKLVLMLIENFKNNYKNNTMIDIDINDSDISVVSKASNNFSSVPSMYKMLESKNNINDVGAYNKNSTSNISNNNSNGSYGISLLNSVFGLGKNNKDSKKQDINDIFTN